MVGISSNHVATCPQTLCTIYCHTLIGMSLHLTLVERNAYVASPADLWNQNNPSQSPSTYSRACISPFISSITLSASFFLNSFILFNIALTCFSDLIICSISNVRSWLNHYRISPWTFCLLHQLHDTSNKGISCR